MADDEQTPNSSEEEQTPPVSQTPDTEDSTSADPVAEQPSEQPDQAPEQAVEQPLAVPTAEAAEIASVVEDGPLEAYEEAHAPSAGDEAGSEAVPGAQAVASDEEEDDSEEEPTPRVKPAVPGADLEVDIVPEGVDPLAREQYLEDPYAIDDDEQQQAPEEEADEELIKPIATAAIDLAADARYCATGKRKTAIARVILRPGSGTYLVNNRSLEEHFPRITLQRNIRQPLETVGYEARMDVIVRVQGGGISAQAGALRHGVSRALLEADPNLRGELKRRGFLTRDSRAKERKKAGLKKARKKPQFSKR